MNLQDYVFRVIVAEEEEVEIDKKTGQPKMVKDKETGEMVQKLKHVIFSQAMFLLK